MGIFTGTLANTAESLMSTNYAWSIAPYPRLIRSICVTGDSGGDLATGKVEVYAGQDLIAELINTSRTAGDVYPMPKDMFKCALYVPANVAIRAKNATACTATLYLHLNMSPTRFVPQYLGFMSVEKESAAAAWAVNSDVADDKTYKTSVFPRVLRYVGLAGGAAIGDTIMELSVGNQMFSELRNSTAGDVVVRQIDDVHLMGQFIRNGQELEVKVLDASNTNAATLALSFAPLVSRRAGFAGRQTFNRNRGFRRF